MESKLDHVEEEEEGLLSVVTEEPGAGTSSDAHFPLPPPPAMFDLGTEEEEGNFLQVGREVK